MVPLHLWWSQLPCGRGMDSETGEAEVNLSIAHLESTELEDSVLSLRAPGPLAIL